MANHAPVVHHPRTGVGRGDLLRLLALWGAGAEYAAAEITGYSYRPPLVERIEPQNEPATVPTEKSAEPPSTETLQAIHYIATRSIAPALPDDYTERLQISEADPAPLPALRTEPPPPWQPLVPNRRLAVFVEKHLRRQHGVNLWDIDKLLRYLTRGEPPVKRKARQQRLRWSGNAVVIEMTAQTEPLHDDYRALAKVVHRRSGGRVPVFANYAGRGWWAYQPDDKREPGREWFALPATPDLHGVGGLAVGSSTCFEAWPGGGTAHAMLVTWEPSKNPPSEAIPITNIPPPAPCRLPMAHWDLGSNLKTKSRQPHAGLSATETQTEQLLALLALSVRTHAPLLRALRGLLGAPAAAEVAVWGHQDVACDGVAVTIRVARRSHYLGILKNMSLDIRQQAAECIEAHHTWLSSEITLEEAQLAHTHAAGANVVRPEAHFGHIARSLHAAPESFDSVEIAAYLGRAGHRTDQATWENAPEFTLAWGIANPEALANPEKMPAHFPPRLLAPLRAAVAKAPIIENRQGLRLRQQDQLLILEPCDAAALAQPAPRPANVLAQWARAPLLQWRSELLQQWQRLASDGSTQQIDLKEAGAIEITDGVETYLVEPVPRPHWALEWARDWDGLYALTPNPWGRACTWYAAQKMPTRLFEGGGHNSSERDDFRSITSFSLEVDGIGPIAKLQVDLKITQSFRYLPPGSFLMGSPESERERDSNENPQHQVTFTEGLWLADTACTQGLWEAVMGNNPSHFKGETDLPVENVSWDDVQEFLAKFEAHLPAGIEAVLPTEAEWEYACRAGSTTPFSFGDNITTDQVNYDGDFPYADAAIGELRGKTVTVKALPANAWGLYQMHGNVWEWCADAPREYTATAMTNPSGATGGGSYAVRGGSWFRLAGLARAARRLVGPRGGRILDLGFRFALRSKSPAMAGGQARTARSAQVARDGPGFGAGAPENIFSKSAKKSAKLSPPKPPKKPKK